MTTHPCEQCGQPLSEQAEFCGRCGAVALAKHPPRPGSRTLLEVVPSRVEPAREEPATAHSEVSATDHAPHKPAHKTIVGIALPGLAQPQWTGEPLPTRAPDTPGRARMNRTMLGVATPGIAPLREGPAPTPLTSGPEEGPSAPVVPHRAALAQTIPIPVQYVPPPAPLLDMTAPAAPRIVRPAGVPLARVALAAGALVLIGGVLIAVLWRGAPPITAQPRVAADGRDTLHLVCDPKSCKDGTIVALDGASAKFSGGEADLPLMTSLRVGDNALALSIDRPGMGRDETVSLVVPVAYRVRADVSTMEAPRPAITIRVQAVPGTDVRIDGRPIALDANGSASYALDETAATEGAADESRVLAVDVPYAVSLRGKPPEKGVVSARVAVAPLRVDAPGATAVVTESQVLLAGRAARGAHVTVDGSPVTVGPDGSFETQVALDALGQRTFEVRSGTATLVPRKENVVISRVASLTEAAQAFEELAPIGYDTAVSTLTNKIGLPIAVQGEVMESRGSAHRTVVLVDDRRGCAAGPCLARVVVGRELTLNRGASLRAYGHVARAFTTAAGQTVPEIEAEFVVGATR